MPDNNTINTGFDQLFSFDKATDYTLIAGVSVHCFSFCVFDHEIRRFLAAGSAVFDGLHDKRQLAGQLEAVVGRFPELAHEMSRKILLYESERCTLVPWPLFDESRADLYYQFNHSTDHSEQLFVNRLKNPETYNLFTVPDEVIKITEKAFGRMNIKHHSTALIEGLLTRFKNYAAGAVTVINIRQAAFDIVVIEDQKLQLFNTFSFKTAEDFIYFVLFVFEQLKLNPETNAVLLAGSITKDSRLYELLYRYIRNIEFIDRPETVAYSYVFDDVPAHFYYHLYQAALCEL